VAAELKDCAMNRFCIVLGSLWLASCAAAAEEAVSFKDKTITLIVASSSGGGTDTSGRLIALLLANSLPGKPTVATTDFPEALAVDDMGRLYASCRTGDLYLIRP
jgi:hypothetical protein